MAYSKRTCNKCGFRNLQPNMRQEKIEYVSGTSQAGLSTRAVLGGLLGSEKSAKQVTNWASGNSKRQYKRTRLVWVCANGCNNNYGSAKTIQKATEPEYRPMSDQENLISDLEHNEYMFGELFLWMKDFDELKNDMGPLSKLTKAEARKYKTEMDTIFHQIKRSVVNLGEIYEDRFNGDGAVEITFKYMKKIINFIMWGWGIFALLAVIFF